MYPTWPARKRSSVILSLSLVTIIVIAIVFREHQKKRDSRRVSQAELVLSKKVPEPISRTKAGTRLLQSQEARVPREELERPDFPGEAIAFRNLQLQDENGSIAPDGLLRAKAHVDAMRMKRPKSLASSLSSSDWTWLGPGNVGGRVRSIAIDPRTSSTWFAGSVGGGIWKTTNAGGTWKPLDDFMANLAVSTLIIQPGAPDTIYAGTGEGFSNVDALQGAGIFKSTDGGATWPQLPSTATADFYFVNRLVSSPDGVVLLAGTRTGLFRSTDGGSTFNSVLSVSDGLGVLDVAFHPTDGTRAVASGGNGNAWFTVDAGSTWRPATGLPGAGRIEVAYVPSTPSNLYAVVDVANGTVYKSGDGGASFASVSVPAHLASPEGDQGWYNNAIWVDPTNADVLVIGGIDLWRSTDGGLTWNQISDWRNSPNSAHADHHAIVSLPSFDGSTNRTVVFGNDGGVYSTTDIYNVGTDNAHTSLWVNENHNLGITQFYGGAGNTSTGTIIAGAQDNGTVRDRIGCVAFGLRRLC